MNLRVKWLDGGREPQLAPNPQYPTGVDIDMSGGVDRTCETKLRYPAPRCGAHEITCRTCKKRVLVSTAGRIDDPRSVRIACDPVKH
jgi:hypothetical protein